MEFRQLASEERMLLKKHHKVERDKRICDRIKTVLAYDDGHSYAHIADILLLDDETIRRHIKKYFSENKLAPENGGSASKFTEIERNELMSHLNEKTYLYVKEICDYVNKTFSISYSISGMTSWLKSNGFCYKKPHGVPAKADLEKQSDFIKAYQTLKETLPVGDVMYFADSSHPQHQTKLAYGWIKKGVRKAQKMTACQKRINIIGAINIANHDLQYQQVAWVNGESIIIFLQQLLDANASAGKIHLYWDNAGYHRSKEILEFIKDTKIVLHYLPPYSPNLNPIERLWKVMHEQVTYNHYYQKFADFTEGILSFFKNIERYKPILQNRINDNFQTLSIA
jgi:transposase